MSILPKYWSQLTSKEFEQLNPTKTVAVWPLGATEQHGPHLPLSVDSDIAGAVIDECIQHLAEDDPVLFLPIQHVGYSVEHAAFAGTISCSVPTLLAIADDIGQALKTSGVKKLLLFNAHGGNVALMDLIARQLRGSYGILVFSTSWYQLPIDPHALESFSAHEHRFGVHAGDIETSLMLHIAPERVQMQHAKDFPSSSSLRSMNYSILGDGRSAKLGWHIQDYNPEGAVGNAANASAVKGKALLASAAKQLANLLQEMILMPPL
jgi:creatinine amidohydrolase